MTPRPRRNTIRRRAGVVGGILLPLLALHCSDDPARHQPSPPCPATPTFLASKFDDDDGDGNPVDENFPTINDEDDDIADHAWMQDGAGVYHLFFQNEDHGAGTEIEHYVSVDLDSLTYVGVALQRNPAGWDSYALWSPHIVELDQVYYMFYTGTNGSGNDPNAEQRIGVATSTDLVTWTRFPVNRCPGSSGDGCIYECAEPWTTWGGTRGSYNRQCRDPFVIWDAAQRRWLLFATARSTNEFGVITVAYSTDLTYWTGAGYVDATRRLAAGKGGQTTGGQAENAFVMSHGGRYYLLFSDWKDPEDTCAVQNPRTIVQYATSPTLAADASGSANWIYHGYIPDAGVNAIEVLVLHGDTWIMSQSIANRSSCDHEAHRRQLVLKRVVWGTDDSFGTEFWAPCPATVRGEQPLEPTGRASP